MWKLKGICGLSIALAAAWLLSACSVLGTGSSKPIDPPPAGTEVNGDSDVSAPASDGSEQQRKKTMKVTLYLKDAEGYIAPVSMEIPQTNSPAKSVLEHMVAEGPYADRIPEGFNPVLPKGTKVNGINIVQDKRLAVVDFSKEFTSYDGADERKLLESLTWTLTEFPSIEQVQLWVNGYLLKEMPVGKTPLDEPLTRAIGINVEFSGDAPLSQTFPVTLYFMNKTPGQIPYYIPVTRMVPRSDDALKTTLEQLIKGPKSTSGLERVLPADARVQNVQESGSLITVNLSGNLLGADQEIPKDMLEAIVLSLTEHRKNVKVQIYMDEPSDAKGSDRASAPVTRPQHINALKL